MSRDALQQYDEVEFIGIRELGVAVSVSVIQRKPKEVRKRSFVVFSTFFFIYFHRDSSYDDEFFLQLISSPQFLFSY